MPTYQYACTDSACGSQFELVQSFTDPAASECPTCGGAVRKRYGSVGVVFKGSGFYRTDSRNDSRAKTAASASESSSNSSSSESKSKTSKDAAASTSSSSSSSDSSSSSSSSSSSATSGSGGGSSRAAASA